MFHNIIPPFFFQTNSDFGTKRYSHIFLTFVVKFGAHFPNTSAHRRSHSHDIAGRNGIWAIFFYRCEGLASQRRLIIFSNFLGECRVAMSTGGGAQKCIRCQEWKTYQILRYQKCLKSVWNLLSNFDLFKSVSNVTNEDLFVFLMMLIPLLVVLVVLSIVSIWYIWKSHQPLPTPNLSNQSKQQYATTYGYYTSLSAFSYYFWKETCIQM